MIARTIFSERQQNNKMEDRHKTMDEIYREAFKRYEDAYGKLIDEGYHKDTEIRELEIDAYKALERLPISESELKTTLRKNISDVVNAIERHKTIGAIDKAVERAKRSLPKEEQGKVLPFTPKISWC